LPYIAAQLIAICLWRLRGLAEKGLIRWFTTGHSVLGGENALPRSDYAAYTRASIAYLPIGIATIVVVVCLFVAALVVTAAMMDSIEQEQWPDARKIRADLAAHWRRILLFALRLLVTFGAFAAGTALPLVFWAYRLDLLTSFWVLAGYLLVAVGCTAWLVMPAAMRLLRRTAAVQVPAQIRNRGTILTILAAEAGAALGFFVPKMEALMILNSRWEITALSVFNSVLANAPDALLFVALTLLATEFMRESDGMKGSRLRELLPLLMPLHFGKGEEPPEVTTTARQMSKIQRLNVTWR
jgi:hypothetical protein